MSEGCVPEFFSLCPRARVADKMDHEPRKTDLLHGACFRDGLGSERRRGYAETEMGR